MQNILFFSEMKDFRVDASSTQIMTRNILFGFKKNGYNITFAAILDKSCNKESVYEDMSSLCDEVVFIDSRVNALSSKRKPIFQYIKMLSSFINKRDYKREFSKLKVDKDTIIVVHAPSIEATFLAIQLKSKFPANKLIQYWSDPYAMSGQIIMENIPIKRKPLALLEKAILKHADSIVYGTKPLCQMQMMYFPKLSEKMRYVDVAYTDFELTHYKMDTNKTKEKIKYGYVGSYVSAYRNLRPLYKVFNQKMVESNLYICGFGDQQLEERDNIKMMSERSPIEADLVESSLDVNICILNKNTIQIPGKIFYKTNSNKPILVILDGPYKQEIEAYLKQFNRFEFCNNEPIEISKKIKDINDGKFTASLITPYELSPEYISNQIIIGGKKCDNLAIK